MVSADHLAVLVEDVQDARRASGDEDALIFGVDD
jgi:hypothetical protein